MLAVQVVLVAVAAVLAVMVVLALSHFSTFMAAQAGEVRGVTAQQQVAVLARLMTVETVLLEAMAAHITPQALTQQMRDKALYTVQAAQQGLMALQVHQVLQVQMATLSTALQTSHS